MLALSGGFMLSPYPSHWLFWSQTPMDPLTLRSVPE
jgi:hypothetical protein